jgi:glycosyltransferase involved in cell wall biosynthesis
LKMNVLLITTYPHGGAGVACRRLQGALSSLGHQVNILYQTDIGNRFGFLAERVSFLPWERNRSVRFLFSLANFGTDISQHPLVQAADVLHLHWWNQGFLSLRDVARLGALGKPIVWTLHDMWAMTGGCHHNRSCEEFKRACGQCPYLRFRYKNDLSRQIWAKKQRLYPKNIHYVTCSQWLEGMARSSSLLMDSDIRTIPNPIDTSVFRPEASSPRSAFQRTIGATPGAHLVLFAAMSISNPYKGFGYLREALQHLKAQRPDLSIEVVALGKSKTGELDGLPYKVHDLGLVKDQNQLVSVYGGVDVFVTPSLEENLPNTIMESMACGTPVVGFDVGGIPEMIVDGKYGRVVPIRDSVALADAMAWVLEDPTRRQALGDAARQSVLARYDQHIVGQQYAALYEEALKR